MFYLEIFKTLCILLEEFENTYLPEHSEFLKTTFIILNCFFYLLFIIFDYIKFFLLWMDFVGKQEALLSLL